MNHEIEQYFEKQPAQQKDILLKIRGLILQIVPSAIEVMSYGVPSLKYNNKTIIYASFSNHIGIYPEPETIEFFKTELTHYETSKGTIKFKLTEPIPYELIERIVRYKFGV